VGTLKALLATMNSAPGQADPANSLVPFGKLENLHFARFVVLDDQTLGDIELLYGLPRVDYPLYLAFLCDFDGELPAFLTDLLQYAGPGLKTIFSFCEDFKEDADLGRWIVNHNLPIATSYVNWRGRTMTQVREEAELHRAINTYLNYNASRLEGQSDLQIWADVRKFVANEAAAGRLKLTPPAPTPLLAAVENLVHLVAVGLLLVLQGPLVLLLVVFVIRPEEATAPVYAPLVDEEVSHNLSVLEDHEFTNQFSAMGSLKPGRARMWVISYILWLINWTARHLYTKGRLARVRTIHFARWVFLDGRKRILFASNYDGSLDSYMDDFINKVGFGLNVVFSNGIGYPSTRWLLLDGAKDEQKFKYFLRRHELPTDVWYDAHLSTTAVELERNSCIRKGLEATALSVSDAHNWVQLL
jgi:hypothetical protein